MKTTLNKIRSHSPCGLNPKLKPLTGYCKLRAYLGEGFDPDEPFSLLTVLDSNGLDDALWCLKAVDGYDKEKWLLAIDFAKQTKHSMIHPLILNALDIAERYANGLATKEELIAAVVSASASASRASHAYARASHVAYVTAASIAANTSSIAAYIAAADAATREYQKTKLIELCRLTMVDEE